MASYNRVHTRQHQGSLSQLITRGVVVLITITIAITITSAVAAAVAAAAAAAAACALPRLDGRIESARSGRCSNYRQQR